MPKYTVKEGQTVTHGEKHGEDAKGLAPAHLPPPVTKTYKAGEQVELDEEQAKSMGHALEGFEQDAEGQYAFNEKKYQAAMEQRHGGPGTHPTQVGNTNMQVQPAEKGGQKGLADRHDATAGQPGQQHGEHNDKGGKK